MSGTRRLPEALDHDSIRASSRTDRNLNPSINSSAPGARVMRGMEHWGDGKRRLQASGARKAAVRF